MFALKQKVSLNKMNGKSRCNSIELDFKSSIKLLYLPWFEPKKTSTKQGLQSSNPPKDIKRPISKKNGCSCETPMLFPCKKKMAVHFCWAFLNTLLKIPKKTTAVYCHRPGTLALDSRVRGNSSLPPGWLAKWTLKRIQVFAEMDGSEVVSTHLWNTPRATFTNRL